MLAVRNHQLERHTQVVGCKTRVCATEQGGGGSLVLALLDTMIPGKE